MSSREVHFAAMCEHYCDGIQSVRTVLENRLREFYDITEPAGITRYL